MLMLAVEKVWRSASVQWRAEPLVLDRSRDDGKVLTRNAGTQYRVSAQHTETEGPPVPIGRMRQGFL